MMIPLIRREEWVTRVSASEHLTSFDSLPHCGSQDDRGSDA